MSEVIWHDVECGRYRQDLGLWLALAAELAPGPGAILDVGAGTGRVTLPLARAGHPVVALDTSPSLLDALALRARGLPVQTVCADARELPLAGREFALVIVPMQTIQLLGGEAGRRSFLRRAQAHMTAGGALAVAIAPAGDFEEFQWRDGDGAPLPDVAEVAGHAYFSQPTAVRRDGDVFTLERRRDIVDPAGLRTTTTDRTRLDVLSAEQLGRDAASAGLRQLAVRRIEATDEHIGSEVVIFQ